jgi:hypothetical protein
MYIIYNLFIIINMINYYLIFFTMAKETPQVAKVIKKAKKSYLFISNLHVYSFFLYNVYINGIIRSYLSNISKKHWITLYYHLIIRIYQKKE